MYIYDENGSPIGIKYRTDDYAEGVFDYFFFEKNLQGDIVAVYNANGRKIGSYVYDAWGNFISSLNSSNTFLEDKIVDNYNPFRYRGYYYDKDLDWYYLQSRYYNPQWGRFINADDIAYLGANGDLQAYNLFAYCSNNPISYIDESGTFLCTLIGTVVGGIFGAATAAISGASGREIWASTVNGMISGGVAGLVADVIAITGGTAGVVIGAFAAAGAVGSFAGSLAESAINGENMSGGDVWVSAAIDAAWGAAFGALAVQ